MKGMAGRILLISKEKGYGSVLVRMLHNQDVGEFEVNQVYPVEKALGELQNQAYDLIILDIPEDKDCALMAEKVCKVNGHLPLVILSESGNVSATRAIRKGAQQVIDRNNLNAFQLSQNVIAAIDQKKIENEIRVRDAILQAVNHAAEIFLTQPNWNLHLDEVLEDLGQATKSDRVYVFQNTKNGEGRKKAVLLSEWAAEGLEISKTGSVNGGVVYEKHGFKRWLDIMQRGEIINGDVEKLPAGEQALLMKLGVKSFVYVPIFSDKNWWGFIGFDQCSIKNKWSQVEIAALKTAANILGAAITRQAADEKLTYLATHDYLTGLPNRMLFEDRFSQAVARSERSAKKFAIVSIDMDEFKSVNDTYGHPMGDKVLIKVARRLEKTIRGSDTCARIGGDEFAVIAEDIRNKGDVMRVMQKISSSLQGEVSIENQKILINASMGASIYPLHGESMEKLFKAADKALYLVKGTKTRYKLFSDDQISWLKD